MAHLLDRPAWNALTTRHAALAEGSALAKRYQPAIVPFAAAHDASAESQAALATLPRPGERMLLVDAGPIVVPDGLTTIETEHAVQLILTKAPARMSDPRVIRLTEADAADMLELAVLTRPGPFTLRAQALGEFFGIRIEGRLAAMAGTRMMQDGYTEVSGVCTHPDFQRQGLARLLSVFMAHRFLDRGETPYLHAYATNAQAIGLYESIGFERRTVMNVVVVGRPKDSAAEEREAVIRRF